MKNFYVLQIESKNNDVKLIDSIIGVEKNYISDIWCYEVIEKEEDNYFDFINNFLDLLDGKYQDLAKIGIQREDISIWMIYEFNGQCNMEFDPTRMKRLGINEIKLCISCYQEEEEK